MTAYNIIADSVSEALAKGLLHLSDAGQAETSRNGPVLVSPFTVVTTTMTPRCRVLTSPSRDANPFFHFMESLWMLAGRRDVAWIGQFNRRIKNYSDDGLIFNAAYGHRWRRGHGLDQLKSLALLLKRDPYTRRAVLQMWSVLDDLDTSTNDAACNTQAYFKTVGGHLNMMVCCRSNDAWWGAHGANAVHFSFLLEYLAQCVDLEVGIMERYSYNYHIYPDNMPKRSVGSLVNDLSQNDIYDKPAPVWSPPLIRGQTQDEFDRELYEWMRAPDDYHGPSFFLEHVARPMWVAWWAHKAKNYRAALDACVEIAAADWQQAAQEWLARREAEQKDRARAN